MSEQELARARVTVVSLKRQLEWLQAGIVGLARMAGTSRADELARRTLRAARMVRIEGGVVTGWISEPLPEQRETQMMLGELVRLDTLTADALVSAVRPASDDDFEDDVVPD